jgi:putative transcriptional regulator
MLKSPQSDQVKVTRKALGFTQKESAEMVHCSLRAWQLWEAGDRNMPAGIWELFVIKTELHPIYGARSYRSAVCRNPAIPGPL